MFIYMDIIIKGKVSKGVLQEGCRLFVISNSAVNFHSSKSKQLFRVSNTAVLLSLHFSFAEAVDTTTDGATAEVQSYFGEAVGLGVVLTVIVIVIVVIVLWLKRRHWVLPCAGDLDL